MSKETTLLRDLLTRAAHAAWQSAAGTFALLWAQSDLHIADLAHGAGWARLYSSVIIGVLAAVASALKTAGVGYLQSRRARLIQIGADAVRAESPTLQADLDSGDLTALIKDVKEVAKSAEPDMVALLATQNKSDKPDAT